MGYIVTKEPANKMMAIKEVISLTGSSIREAKISVRASAKQIKECQAISETMVAIIRRHRGEATLVTPVRSLVTIQNRSVYRRSDGLYLGRITTKGDGWRAEPMGGKARFYLLQRQAVSCLLECVGGIK